MKNLNLIGLAPLLMTGWVLISGCTGSTSHTEQSDKASQVLPEGVELVEQNTVSEDEVGIPYLKYRLDNGLTVVLHQDTSDPLVHVDVTYHVGSSREEVGKSGFAHFFEHMMFQGSKHVGDDQHFEIITEAGGDLNGTTNSDRTNYYQTVPANQLEKVLWLEADRMGFLLDAVTQEKFEIQRETVKNERGQRVDNQPYGLRQEKVSEALYPSGHPYSWQTIGYVEDLDRVNVNDLKAFFKRWYGPNNAVLTIGGDIDIKQTLQWVTRYFGSIPTGPEVNDIDKTPVTLNDTRYLTLEDQVYLPLVQITFPTVHVRHEDEAPLDVLSDILGGGKTSLFYKNLVKDDYAVQAVVSHPCRELACEFQLIALSNPSRSADLTKVYNRIQETLDEFEQRGVNQDDLNRTKASIESSTIFGLQSVSGKVATLASNQLFNDEPDMVQYDLDRYNAVTADDVMRVYKQYIKDKANVVLSIVPQGQTELAAQPANFKFERDLTMIESSDVVDSVAQPVINDDFDRSVIPQAGDAPVVEVPDLWRYRFDNGINIIGHQSDETPTVTLTFSMEGGPLLDSKDKAGLAALTATMMNESTKNFANEELANQLALLGSQISFSAGGRFTQVTVLTLTKNLDATLALLEEKLFNPAFAEDEFARQKQRLIESVQQQMKQPQALAAQAVTEVLYGEDNRISLPDIGTLNTIRGITLDDINAFYRTYYSPAKASLVVVGAMTQDEILSRLDFLREWRGSQYDIPEFAAFPENQTPSIYLVDKPDAAQSIVRVVKRSLPYDAHGKQFKAKLMNFPLGGMFNSRINMNLREDKGYTYGASSGFIGGKSLGRFQVSTDLNIENTVEGITEIFNEIKVYRENGVSESELALMRAAYTQSEALEYETPFSKARFLRHLLVYDLPANYREQQMETIRTIQAAELNQLAQELLAPESMQIIVVSDAQAIEKALKELNRPIIRMNVSE